MQLPTSVLRRVNFYRSMAQLPSVSYIASAEQQCREAALVYSAQNQLAHDIPESFSCYTETALLGGQTSNIALGTYGVGAVDGYISDDGVGNEQVGHRRWLLFPKLSNVATGDTGSTGTSGVGRRANAIAVLCNGCQGSTRAVTPDDIVLWPSAVGLGMIRNDELTSCPPRVTSRCKCCRPPTAGALA